MNPELDEIPMAKLVGEIMRRQMVYESGKCPYCKHELYNQEAEIYCPQCKHSNTSILYHPGCLASLKAII